MERYDIKPAPTGEWYVIDTANGGAPLGAFPTREAALREARRRERR